jgi:nucleotide-binding universal stress UspA family protein
MATYELPRILVCVDFSAASERAVAEAGVLAQWMGAQLDFVHVAPSATDVEAREALHALEASVREDGLVAKAHLGVGSAVAGILDFIARLHPVLVVAGSHGRGAMMGHLVGSVAENLIRRSPVPVLVVPAPNDGRECRVT